MPTRLVLFVFPACLCLNYNNYSHKESRCSLFTQKYLGILSSRHLWKLVQISLLAEVNETFFGSFFVCLFVVAMLLAISADLNEKNVSSLLNIFDFFSM